MAVETRKDADALVVQVHGRIDSSSAGDLQEALERDLTEDVTSLVVDLADVDFISSKGLRVLVGAHRRLDGGTLVITGANSSIREVLRLSGLLKVFTVR